MQLTIPSIEKQLSNLYPITEVKGIVRIMLENVCGWNYTEQVLKRNEQLSEENSQKINAIIDRLKAYEPIQYILGETEFYGLKLSVTPDVLIPRPETEELVQWIVESKTAATAVILDVGTGSGCIALSLKNQLPDATVYGVDVSEIALEVARRNAVENNLQVHFSQTDILNWQRYHWGKYDVIVSNPPYVRKLEKPAMNANVLNFEPESALFVPDHDPLIFYRKIAELAQNHLTKNGMLFFEINENLAAETSEMLQASGFQNIRTRKDLNGKQRMLCCIKEQDQIL